MSPRVCVTDLWQNLEKLNRAYPNASVTPVVSGHIGRINDAGSKGIGMLRADFK